MALRRNRATVSPTLHAFGRRLRRYREAKGWSQDSAARRANGGAGVTPQYVGMVETGRTRCTREFAETMDRELAADGQLVELWDDLVKDAAFPIWFDWPSRLLPGRVAGLPRRAQDRSRGRLRYGPGRAPCGPGGRVRSSHRL